MCTTLIRLLTLKESVMKRNTVSAVILASLVAPSAVIAAQTFEDNKQVELKTANAIEINLAHAKIHFIRTDSNQADLSMSQILKKGSEEDCLQHFDITQSGNKITIATEKKDSSWSFFGNDCEVERNIVIALGKGELADLKLNIAHAKFNAEQIDFITQDWKIAHSNLTIKLVNASNSKLNIAHSLLNVADFNSVNNEINGAHSQLSIQKYFGSQLDESWQHGQFTINNAQLEKLKQNNAHSEIMINQLTAKFLNADNEHTRFVIQSAQVNNIDVELEHGEVKLDGRFDKVKLETQHAYNQVRQSNDQPILLSADVSHGNLDLYLPEKLSYSYQLNDKQMLESNSASSKIKVDISHGNSSVFRM